MNPLESVSPIDGRYKNLTKALGGLFSEFGLNKYRVIVEIEYLLALLETKDVKIRKLSEEEIELLRNLTSINPKDVELIKKIEKKGHYEIKATNHDVKAIEYFIKSKLEKTSLEDLSEWIHFGLTSEDVNSVAYGLIVSESIRKILLPKLDLLVKNIKDFSEKYKKFTILARTHGQPASPTTLGKEFKVFYSRLLRQNQQLRNREILVKFSGATGNFSAQNIAYPKIDWVKFSYNFINKINNGNKVVPIKLNMITTQIEPNDSYAELFDTLKRINIILIDFCQDVWRYISDDWIVQKPIEGEIGSSTMPHKINPINFENAEGNLGLANAILEFFSKKLPISRLQRDLSDSTVKRNIGVAFGHCLISYDYILGGLSRIQPNKLATTMELQNHPEVVSEAIQTILRREGVSMPYEKLRILTRGKNVNLKKLHKFINSLKISSKVKTELKRIRPENYTGLASKL